LKSTHNRVRSIYLRFPVIRRFDVNVHRRESRVLDEIKSSSGWRRKSALMTRRIARFAGHAMVFEGRPIDPHAVGML